MKKNLILLTIIIFISILYRVLPHPANFSPILAVSLVSGMYFSKKMGLTITFVTMLLSDLILGLHNTMFFVYLSLGTIVLLGSVMNKKTYKKVFALSILSSIIFFIITNLGVFLVTPLYPKTIEGLVDCFVLALPFFRNSLASTVFYSIVIFTAIRIAENLLFKLSNNEDIYTNRR